jgi:hypothetical protein
MEKKHHARTLPIRGHVKKLWWGVTQFFFRIILLECVVFLSLRHCFYFCPDMERSTKNLCCACSTWSGFSVARTCFGLIIKHWPDLCQIGGMISPDKKDSFRVIYFKNRALKDFKKTCQSGTIFPIIKISATEKTWITFLFLKRWRPR